MNSKTSSKRYVVLDIGGTSIKSGVFVDNILQEVKETDTNAKLGGTYVLQKAMEIISDYGTIDGIGISTAGQVDYELGSIRYANSNIPGYTGMKIRELLEDKYKVQVVVENDVNAAALGEIHYGIGTVLEPTIRKDILCLTYGTGVGGAIVIDGNLYRGSTYSAGEVGALIIHPEDRDARVDMFSGCYEKYASTTALIHRIQLVDESITNGRQVFEQIHREEIRFAVDQWIKEITLGLITLIHVFNPAYVLLGGGIMEQSYLLDKIDTCVHQEIMESYRHVKLLKTNLGNQAGLYGALYLLQSKLKDSLSIDNKGSSRADEE